MSRTPSDKTTYSKEQKYLIKQNPRLNIIKIDDMEVLEINKRSIRTSTGKLLSPKELNSLSYCLPTDVEKKFFEQLEEGGELPENYKWNLRNNTVYSPMGYIVHAKFKTKARPLTLRESISKYNGGKDIPSVIKEITALANGTSKSKTPSIALAANKLLLEAYYKEELSKTSTQTVDVNVKHDIMQLIAAARRDKQLKNITDEKDLIESSIQ